MTLVVPNLGAEGCTKEAVWTVGTESVWYCGTITDCIATGCGTITVGTVWTGWTGSGTTTDWIVWVGGKVGGGNCKLSSGVGGGPIGGNLVVTTLAGRVTVLCWGGNWFLTILGWSVLTIGVVVCGYWGAGS